MHLCINRYDNLNIISNDLRNLEESWKLKRNQKLIKEKINSYLDNNKDIDFDKLKLTFNWLDREYTTHADTLFVVVE